MVVCVYGICILIYDMYMRWCIYVYMFIIMVLVMVLVVCEKFIKLIFFVKGGKVSVCKYFMMVILFILFNYLFIKKRYY